jgi:shikimate kinase
MSETSRTADVPALDRTVVLVGMMGAGKTTIGRRLAARINLPFVDADAEIEAAAGCSIEDFFASHGEAQFRDGEHRVIARLLDRPVHVLATGGGAFMDPRTRARIAERGVSIWLRADIGLLLRRVGKRPNRPLLKTADPRAVLERLLAERSPVYALADLTVDSVDAPHDTVVDTIIAALAEHTARQPADAAIHG